MTTPASLAWTLMVLGLIALVAGPQLHALYLHLHTTLSCVSSVCS